MEIDYKLINWSSENLSKKLTKLINDKMINQYEDIINLTGVIFIFEIPFCAN